jgi:hypothetical protein
MAGLGNLVTTKIITKGLSCGAAADQGTITSFFGLFYVAIAPAKPNGWHGGGGGIPLQPGQIANLYKPVNDQYTPTQYIPRGQEDEFFRNRYIVTIKVNDHEVIYRVNDKTGKMVVSIMNVINLGKEKIKVAINNVMVKRLKVVVENVRKSIFK